MTDPIDAKSKRSRHWMSAITLVLAHLIAFGMLYLVLVQINWAHQDFYKIVGAKWTPEFSRIAVISNYIAAYTPAVLLVLALDIVIVFRLARRGSRWTSTYSHIVLLCMGFTGFLWTAWGIGPMAWGIANKPRPAAVEVDQSASVFPVDAFQKHNV